MPRGNVYIFSSWTVAPQLRVVAGNGELLDANRQLLEKGDLSVSIDSVAIFESNDVRISPTVAGMTVITLASLFVTSACATNPKACFGSCPTFYVWDGQELVLEGEGFSGSVAPCLEARDIDALVRARPTDGILEVVMRNEALETHVIRAANLIAVPRGNRQRVFHSAGRSRDGLEREYWQIEESVAPARCIGPEGDCTDVLARFDRLERTSPADSVNLATRESIELFFDEVPNGDLGLVIAFRQTLLTTFLFYQTLAYMGTSVGAWFAALETAGDAATEKIRGVGDALGGIQVLVGAADGTWMAIDEIYETGPLATNHVVVPLRKQGLGPVRVRLYMAKGAWRLDSVALSRLEDQAGPIRLAPVAVIRDGRLDDYALGALRDAERVLTTLPGDEYTLVYHLPESSTEYELFLESQGYYLEWIREQWLDEEDHASAAMLLFDSKRALVELAPKFKQFESQMEETFWNSRYARP